MIKIRAIFTLTFLLLLSCSESAETLLIEEQQEDIVKFLTSSHSPTLIDEGEIAESLEDDPEFFTTYGNTAYRYIADFYNPEREERKEVKAGSILSLTFWCYDFSTYSKPTSDYLFYTNDPLYKEAFELAGLNTEYWSFEPLNITLGKGDILKAIETSLVSCREGDYVEIYLTYNLAYGSSWIGLTSFEAPIAFFCTIDSIEN
ncbi:MAG: hypothetical protein R3Y08_08110 [Rikenellaceae bacterium]